MNSLLLSHVPLSGQETLSTDSLKLDQSPVLTSEPAAAPPLPFIPCTPRLQSVILSEANPPRSLLLQSYPNKLWAGETHQEMLK